MENKKVGWLIIGIAGIITFIIGIFNYSLRRIINTSCIHGPSCPMNSTANIQLYLSISIIAVIVAIGLYIMFSKPEEKTIKKTIIKKVKEKKKLIDTSKLDEKEKKAIELLQKENKVMFQADLKEKLEIGKVGMTRLLDKLEAKQIIERKRRGMNNLVILK